MLDYPIELQQISEKFSKLSRQLDCLVSHNVKESNVKTRPKANNGIWCCLLLPGVLLLYSTLHDVSNLYKLVASISLGLLFYCLLFIVFISVSGMVIAESIYDGCIASSLVSTLLLYTCLNIDLVYSLVATIPTIHLFSLILRELLNKCPNTFTIGEAMIVSQSIVLYGFMIFARFFCIEGEDNEDMHIVSTVVDTVLSTVSIITIMLYTCKQQRTLETLKRPFIGGIIYALTVLHCSLGLKAVPKILTYIFIYKDRYILLLFWLFLVIVALGALSLRTKMAGKASTGTRKLFHLLASLVFMTGIIMDMYLMMMAAGIGLGLLLFAETLRKSRIEPMSSTLQSAFNVYSDEKDAGEFAMTAIYMYCGLACPLALTAGVPLEALSGVLAIGIGDSAASFFGANYGLNKWPNSNKTIEGTMFNILSQILTVYLLTAFEIIDSKYALLRTAIAATLTALVEAKTDQIDNLVLPLIMLLTFQLTFFLS